MNSPQVELHCDQCGRPMGLPPPTAPHKRFCSRECRLQWHGAEIRRAREALRALEAEEKREAEEKLK